MKLSPGVDGSPTKSSDQETFYSCESLSPTPGQSLVDTGFNIPESSEELATTSCVPTENQSLADIGSNILGSSEELVTPNCVTTEKLVGIKLPPLAYPKSSYSPWIPPLPPVASPRAATRALVSSKSSYQGEEFVALDLDDFTFYRTSDGPHSHEMVPLQEVASKQGTTQFLLDGILSNEDNRVYLQRAPFRYVSTGGYENVKQHSIGLDLWIQSADPETRQCGIWYRLLKPALEYARFHESFLWLANLGKHVVDYISENEHEIKRITLLRFQRDFALFLQYHHKGDSEFESWYSQHQSMDFRQAMVAHRDYLQKQAADIDARYGQCPLWSEIGVTSSIVKEQPLYESQTVLTPYVFDCFKHMEWAHCLKPIKLDTEVKEKQRQRLEALNFVQKRKPSTLRFGGGLKSAPILRGKTSISCGDVIATKRDTDTVWKGNHDDLWYAFVQHIEDQSRKGRIWLHVIWLYKPSDTVCANMVYPFDNELFMSDHCNCADAKIEATEVVQKAKVSFFSDGTNVKKSDFFIRQSYHSEDETFATLKEENFCCDCRRTNTSSISTHNYTLGDTVLVESICNDDVILEPAEIMDIQKTGDIQIRELLRRRRDFKEFQCRPNELVYTNNFREIHVDQIDRRCHVRLYTREDVENGSIPAPYNRDGNGDAFYITSQEGNPGLQPQPVDSITFKQGFDPNHSDFKRLRALNIFCGGGSFDRGLEEGAAIQNEWAVEWGVMPMLTYRANHSDPEKLKLFCGSVNDYLSMAIRGKGKSQNVAQIEQPEFLSAGSPCQGYSLANPQKTSPGALRNCSMVASVMAFVDLYRFKYGLLENVTAMANKSIKNNPLSQIFCCLVGMGYQCRILNLDAWSFGAPQSRSRLFVSFAAPGLKLPEHPQLTHSHPIHVNKRSLGRAANGLPFGNRRWQTPVFDYITAAKSVSDLPDPGIMCVSKPDHRCSKNQNFFTQTRINQIPKAPYVEGLANATKRSRLNQSDTDSTGKSKLACKGSRAWSRVHPHGLIPTVTTAANLSCRFTGRWLHWDQDRLITIMEARRAQGYPDDEVLVGRPANQWKIVGNSVARQVALALGLSLREACLENEKRSPPNGQPVPGEVGEAVILSDTEEEDERETSTLDHYDEMDEAVNTLTQFQRDREPFSALNGHPIRKTNIAVEISSHDDSSRSTKSTRMSATSTEPSSRDDGVLVPSKKRSLGDYQLFIISDDEETMNPIRRKKRKALLGDCSSPIILD